MACILHKTRFKTVHTKTYMLKAVILAGGFGTRLGEETNIRPKPLIEIGGMPMLWHIMKIYSTFNIGDFVICCGYKGHMIKEYFANYHLHTSDITIDVQKNRLEVHRKSTEPWRVTLVDTGIDTMTGGRIKRIKRYVQDDTFCMTYGDGVGNVDITSLLKFHRAHGRAATVTAVRPPGRFGIIRMNETGTVTIFNEKPQGDNNWINGGFFVLEPSVFDYISGDQTVWEKEPMESLTADGNLMAYKHDGFWQPVDTLREKNLLEQKWQSKDAPWKVW